LQKGEIPAETEILTETNRLNEYIMTSLRTIWGLDLKMIEKIAAGASPDLLKAAQEFFEREWIIQKDNIIYITSTGKLYADKIASGLFF
ncbi:MAG TPA: hypothetical protein VNX40_11660, partial [Mucilaginibacter sp.]|nr:hypothetical protein [Mucilaginibacter sp.]